MSAAAPTIAARGLPRTLFALAWPTLIAQAAVMAYGVVDTLMAGRISALDLAAVGIGASIYATIFMALMGVLFALSPIVSHHYGAGRFLEIGADIRQSFWLVLLLSALALVLLNNPEPLFALARVAPETEIHVRAYLQVLSWGVPASLMFRVFFGLAIGVGRARAVMVLNVGGLALKLACNWLLMFGHMGLPPLGATGAAAATALAMWGVALVAWLWCWRDATFAQFAIFSSFEKPHLKAQWELLRLGLPISGALIVDVSAFTLMALFIARFGARWSAAHQIAASLAVFCYIVPLSLGHATGVLVGQALGAGNAQGARAIGRLGAAIALGWGCFMFLLLLFSSPRLARLFTDDSEVQAVAIPLLATLAVFQWGDAVQGVVGQVLRGYKHTLAAMLIVMIPLWGLGLAGGYVLAFTDWLVAPMGAIGFWWAESAGLALAALMMWLYFAAIAGPAPSVMPVSGGS